MLYFIGFHLSCRCGRISSINSIRICMWYIWRLWWGTSLVWSLMPGCKILPLQQEQSSTGRFEWIKIFGNFNPEGWVKQHFWNSPKKPVVYLNLVLFGWLGCKRFYIRQILSWYRFASNFQKIDIESCGHPLPQHSIENQGVERCFAMKVSYAHRSSAKVDYRSWCWARHPVNTGKDPPKKKTRAWRAQLKNPQLVMIYFFIILLPCLLYTYSLLLQKWRLPKSSTIRYLKLIINVWLGILTAPGTLPQNWGEGTLRLSVLESGLIGGGKYWWFASQFP